MIGREKFDRFLARRGIVQMKGPEAQAAYAVYQERTDGFLDVAWHKHGWTPAKLKEAFDQFGFDCYTQGCIDGATTVKMRPELLEFMRASDNSSSEHR